MFVRVNPSWRAVAVVVFLTLFVVPRAQAQDTPRVYLTEMAGYNGQVPDLILEQIEKTVRDRIDADPTVDLVARVQANNTMAMSPAISEAVRLYEQGRAQYVDQRYSEAAQSLTQSLDYLEANIGDIKDWGVVEDCIYRLSASLYFAGEDDRGKTIINKLLTYNREFFLSADEELPDSYRTAFAAAEKALKKRGEGSIDSSPLEDGTEIWVNGELRGAAPMQVDGVTAGSHYILLRKGEAVWGGMVLVEKKKPTALTAVLGTKEAAGAPDAALVSAVSTGSLGDETRLAARDLAKSTASPYVLTAIVFPTKDGFAVQPVLYTSELSSTRKLDHVLFDKDLLSVNVDGYSLSRNIIDGLYDASLGEVVDGSQTLTPSDYEKKAASTAIANVNTNTGNTGNTGNTNAGTGNGNGENNNNNVTVNNGNGEGDDKKITGFQDEESWYENPWVWTGVGAGVAAIATLAIVLSLSDSGSETAGFNATIEW